MVGVKWNGYMHNTRRGWTGFCQSTTSYALITCRSWIFLHNTLISDLALSASFCIAKIQHARLSICYTFTKHSICACTHRWWAMESSGMDLCLSTCIYTNHGGGFWDENQYKTSRRFVHTSQMGNLFSNVSVAYSYHQGIMIRKHSCIYKGDNDSKWCDGRWWQWMMWWLCGNE